MADDYLVNATFNVRTRKVELVGRIDTYEDTAPDVFFVPRNDLEKLPRKWTDRATIEGGFARIPWPEPPKSGAGARKRFFAPEFEKWGVTPLEADVDPVRRYILDHPKLALPDAEQWRVLKYDIETEKVDFKAPWRSRVLGFSWSSKHLGKRGHVRTAAKTDAAELATLRAFRDLMLEHDVVIAWSHWDGDTFDHKVMQGRGELLGERLPVDAVHWLDHLTIFKRHMVRTDDGGQRQSFKLDAIAESFLKTERKVPLKERAIALGFRESEHPDLYSWVWEHAPDLFREYNDQDVHLMDAIEDKTSFIALHLTICKLCRILPTRWSQKPLAMIDGRLLTRGAEMGFRFPSKPEVNDDEEQEKAMGAYVPEAQIGLFEKVGILDFSKMYPSIILAWNMSLETSSPDGAARVPLTTETGAVVEGQYIQRFRTDVEGVIPSALRIILAERAKWSKLVDTFESESPDWKKAKRISNALKVLANTFYGSLLSKYARWYRQDIGSSVTSIGRLLLSRTIRAVEASTAPRPARELAWACAPKGRLVFGDTDSAAFVATSEDARAMQAQINTVVIPQIVEEYGARPGEVSIGYDKHFSRVVVTASKKYAGKKFLDGGKPVPPDAPPDVRGLEIVRSDVTPAARNLQRAVLLSVLSGSSPQKVKADIVEVREAFLAGKTPMADLILRKSITKELDEYTNSPPQVEVATRMVERGEEVEVGQKIAFFYERGGPVAPSEIEGEEGATLDLGLYWNKHVWPPTYRLVRAAFPDEHWEIDVARGWDPNQLDMFKAAPASKRFDAPERPMISAPETAPASKRFDAAPVGPPAPRYRKAKVAPAPPLPVLPPPPPERRVRRAAKAAVTITVPEDSEHVERAAALLDLFPGDHPLFFVVRVEAESALVTLKCPKKIADPSVTPGLVTALARLGWRWNIAPHGRAPT